MTTGPTKPSIEETLATTCYYLSWGFGLSTGAAIGSAFGDPYFYSTGAFFFALFLATLRFGVKFDKSKRYFGLPKPLSGKDTFLSIVLATMSVLAVGVGLILLPSIASVVAFLIGSLFLFITAFVYFKKRQIASTKENHEISR